MNRLLVVPGALLMVLLTSSCSTNSPGATPQSPEPPAAPQSPAPAPPESPAAGSAKSNRRVFESCDPAERAARYEDWVDDEVLITFAWDEMGKAADLRVPAVVTRIDSPYVAVIFDHRVPNIELYTSVWTYSGHIRPNADGTMDVDPCSATFERGGW